MPLRQKLPVGAAHPPEKPLGEGHRPPVHREEEPVRPGAAHLRPGDEALDLEAPRLVGQGKKPLGQEAAEGEAGRLLKPRPREEEPGLPFREKGQGEAGVVEEVAL